MALASVLFSRCFNILLSKTLVCGVWHEQLASTADNTIVSFTENAVSSSFDKPKGSLAPSNDSDPLHLRQLLGSGREWPRRCRATESVMNSRRCRYPFEGKTHRCLKPNTFLTGRRVRKDSQ